jgi:hypothetical protein
VVFQSKGRRTAPALTGTFGRLLEPVLYGYHETTPLLLAERNTAAFAIRGVANHYDLVLDTDLYALTTIAVFCRTPDSVIS